MNRTEELLQGIKGFEDLCKKRGDNPEDILPWKTPINARQMAANDREMIDYIGEYIQDGYKANWADEDEEKYFAIFWFDSKKSAFVFTRTHYYWTATHTVVGSRLCFPSRAVAEAFGRFTEEIHARLLANNYPQG